MIATYDVICWVLDHYPVVYINRTYIFQLLSLNNILAIPYGVRPRRHVLVAAHLRQPVNTKPLLNASLIDLQKPGVREVVGSFEGYFDKMMRNYMIVDVNG